MNGLRHHPRGFLAQTLCSAQAAATLLCLGFSGSALRAETAAEISEAARNVGRNNSPYHEALVLKHINEIHLLRGQGLISDADYQNVMAWHQAENLGMARRAAAALGYEILPQAVDPTKGAYRTGSDSDYLVRRRDGQPLTLEDVQAMERAYRMQVNQEVRTRSQAAGKPVAPPAKEFNTGTDFMAGVDGTSEAEFNRIAAYQKAKGADTYSRYDAAVVESQMRTPGSTVGLAQGGSYVSEMLDMAAKKDAKIAHLREQLAGASPAEQNRLRAQIDILTFEQSKYVQRVNEVNGRLAQQSGLPPPSPIGPAGDYAAAARAQYALTLGRIAAAQPPGSDLSRQSHFLLALQIYDLPEGKRQTYLNWLDPKIQQEVRTQVEIFRRQEQTRVSAADVARLQGFLRQTETGRKLLSGYDWAFKELTRERSRVTQSSQFLGDVAGELNATSQHVANRAQSLAMWMDVVRQVRDAKSDADLAIGLGRTLASRTYYGMVASYAYTGLVEGDATALAKSLIIMLCPQAALPQVVQSIGDSAIDVTTSVLFDHQFLALYAAASFDPESGELTAIAEYGGSSAVSQFVDDALLPGGYKMVEGVFDRALALGKEKNLSQEVLSGINVAGSMALVRALQSTILGGAPQVMKDDSGLLGACAEVNACTTTINDFVEGCGHKGSVPLDADPGWGHPSLDSAQQKPLNDLLALRVAGWGRAKSALCAGIKASLEARHRAESKLDQGKEEALKLLAAVEKLFRELDMYEAGMAWLNYEAQFNVVMRNLVVSTKDQRIKAMETLQRYHAAYSAVHQLRATLESTYVASGGRRLTPRPLTGLPLLTADPAFDRAAASALATAAMQELADNETYLLRVKRNALNDNAAQLDDPFDKRTYGGICGSIISLHNSLAAAKGAAHARSRLYKVQVLALNELFAQSSAAFDEAGTWRERIKKLTEEFEAYYKPREPGLTILPPPAVLENRAVAGTAYAFRIAASNVPPEAVYVWYQDRTEIQREATLLQTFEKEGTYALRVVASWKASERVRRAGQASASLSCTVGKPGSDADKRPTLEILLPRGLAGGTGQSGVAYDFGVKAQAVPESAACAWYSGDQQVGSGRKLARTFAAEGTVNLAVCATWEVTGSAGAEETWARAAFAIGPRTGQPRLAIIPPPDVDAGKARVRVDYLFVAAPENVPDNAAYRWSLNGTEQRQGAVTTLSFPAEGAYAIGLDAAWPGADGAAAGGGRATAALTVRVAKPEEPTKPAEPVVPTPPEAVAVEPGPEVKPATPPATPPEGQPAVPPATTPGAQTHKPTGGQPPPVVGPLVTAKPPPGAAFTAPPGGDVFYGSTKAIAFGAPPGLSAATQAANARFFEALRKAAQQPLPPRDTSAQVRAAEEALRNAQKAKETWFENVGKSGGPAQPSLTPEQRAVANRGVGIPSTENNPVASDEPSGAFLNEGAAVTNTPPRPAAPAPPAPPATGALRFVFQASPNVTFNPLESADGKTSVTFERMGPIKVWALVYTNATAAPIETPQTTYTVKGPAFVIACDPPGAKVGEEVTARVTATPPIPEKLVRYVWFEPASSMRQELSDNADRIGFKPREARPVALRVEARVPHYGETIGTAEAVYEPSLYKVTAEVLGRLGPKPLIWSPSKGGLVPAPDNAYVVDEAIRLKATLTGEPRPDPVRWSWAVNEGTTLRGSGLGDTISVTRSEAGNATATVTARDKEGRELGTATATCAFAPNAPPPPLTVTVAAAAPAVKSGAQVAVRATIKGGMPPYAVAWAGAEGQGESALVKGERAGPRRVTATVTDKAGKSANAGVEVAVEAIALEAVIRGETRPLLPGEVLPLRAGVRGGAPPYTYAWTGTAGAEGEQATFQALRAGAASVGLRVTDAWGNAGEAALALTVKALTLTAEIAGVAGDAGLVWDEATHTLKPATGQYAVGQRVRVRAAVVGAPVPAGAAFAWTAGNGGRLAGAAGGAETEVLLEAKGTVEAVATLSSAAAGALGSAAVQIPVALSLEEIEAAKKKAADWTLAQENERKAQALIAEGYALEKKGDLAKAIEKYRAALALKDDPRVRKHMAELETKVKGGKLAQELIAKGQEMEAAGRLSAAVAAYREALGIQPDEGLTQRVARLRQRIVNEERAQELVDAGYANEQAGKVAEAVAAYEEAVKLKADPKVQGRIDGLRARLEREAQAQQFVQQGFAREQAKDWPGAIEKYQAAHELCPDDKLAKHIAELQAKLAAQAVAQAKPAPDPKPAPPPPPVVAQPRPAPAPTQAPAVAPGPAPVARKPVPTPAPAPAPDVQRPVAKPVPAPAAKPVVVPAARNLTGVFKATFRADGETSTMTLTLRQEGSRVTGRMQASMPGGGAMDEALNATLRGNQLIVAEGEEGGGMTVSADGDTLTMTTPDGTVVFKRVN